MLACVMTLGRLLIVPNLVLINQGIFSRKTPENRPLPEKAYIIYATSPCPTSALRHFQHFTEIITAVEMKRFTGAVSIVHLPGLKS